MTYCTNCGKETTKNICEHCGVKNNKVHNYCFWCGEKINENASICVNCKEHIKPNKVLKILGILLSLPCISIGVLFCFIVLFNGIAYITAVFWFFTGAFLCIKLPKIHQNFKIKTYEKLDYTKTTNRIIPVVCSVMLIAFTMFALLIPIRFINTVILKPEPLVKPTESVEEKIGVDETNANAAKAATIILQQDLKNPLSLQVHKSWVSYKYALGDDNYYDVTLDYSAENGFGGMNRESITLEIRYDTTERMYYYSYIKILLD